MHDFILGAIVIVDALVGLVTWRGVGTVLFGTAVILGFLAAAWASLAAVLWLATRVSRS
jgi:hypothetical protein